MFNRAIQTVWQKSNVAFPMIGHSKSHHVTRKRAVEPLPGVYAQREQAVMAARAKVEVHAQNFDDEFVVLA